MATTKFPVATAAHSTRDGHIGRHARNGLVGAAVMVTFTAMLTGAASAQPGEGDTTANVGVSPTLTLSGQTASFNLTGMPGDVVTNAAAVTYNVETNNLAGYSVTVVSASPAMTGADLANADTIPISAMSVLDEAIGGERLALSNSVPAAIFTQADRSAAGGDEHTNNFRVTIPFVNADTYSATLNYVVTAL